ncbi:MAG: sigma factor-like helix-turn-helix DNA-binding protein, partial [Actinomycetota bacterium]
AALASLPERQRAAVVLRYVEEYSVSEVAEALDVGYEAAESLLARGRRGFVEAHRKARTP